METILTWVLGIIVKTALIVLVWATARSLIRNGGETLKTLLETMATAIRYGCLRLREKMILKLRASAKEKEPTEEGQGPEVKVEGTVV